ncbi:hypothetical protein FIC94_18405 [Ochrobactrum teleogrylli]|uniref:Aspartate/ornithine carbamoyltransferase carbamoyl-P binding domain-containing protein n=1 Tax=Ochrobactrum teleogrylli TaxID=2479765 RepID=A0ABY2XZV3_9HYPH|nr:hypothetical protein FIC94_18405 [[Ochrobactrum] teleogrylli]
MTFQANRDFLEFHSLPIDTLASLLERSEKLAREWDSHTMPQTLKDKRIGLIVDDTGWRNTVAFDLGAMAMGGIVVQPPISFNARETTADLAGYVDNWYDLLVVRTKELATLKELASAMRAPVINARTRSNHPCETLGDLAHVRKIRSSLGTLKVVGIAPDANILRSWVSTLSKDRRKPTHILTASTRI